MKSEFKVQILRFKVGSRFVFFFLLFAFCLLSACSVPSLQANECNEARPTVKEFFSYHFGNDMNFTAENLKQRERFLTTEFTKRLQAEPQAFDPFTLTNDTPKAFRVGGCTVIEPNQKTDFEILLFWKTETRSEQRAIHAEVTKQNDHWLIDRILSKTE